MYYQPETGKTFTTHSEVRSALPWVLFGASISQQDLAEMGVFPLIYERPECTALEIAVPVAVELVDGHWTQQWEVRLATPDEIEASKPPVPIEVTMRQARLALLGIGVLDQVASAIEALGGVERETARIEWNHSSVVHRDSPLVAIMGAALGLDDEQLNQLFITAAAL